MRKFKGPTRSTPGSMPKSLERMASGFPALQLGLIAMSVLMILMASVFWGIVSMVVSVYVLPLLVWHAARRTYPLNEGVSKIGIKEPNGNSWLVAHRLQMLFITFPSLERVFFLIPGAFSLWLRLWGSSIGSNVVWTPRVDVVDRTHLDVGDFAIIGDKASLCAHTLRRRQGGLVVLVKTVKVGEKSIVGYGSVLGPGAVVASQTAIPPHSRGMLGRMRMGDSWQES